MNSGRRYCRWKFLLTGILRVIYCRERTFPPIVSCPIGRRGKDSFGSSPQTGRERWEYLGRAGEILGKGRKPQGKGAKTPGVSKEQLSALYEWFAVPDNYEFIVNGNNVSAFPKAYLSELSALRSSLRIVQAGVDVAELKGKDWMPAHGLAMSIALNPDAFAHEEIGREQAISYLRKEAVVLSETAPRGIVLLTYKQIPLGFVKNIGNRANNLYPQEWRIRSGYLPEGVLELATITG